MKMTNETDFSIQYHDHDYYERGKGELTSYFEGFGFGSSRKLNELNEPVVFVHATKEQFSEWEPNETIKIVIRLSTASDSQNIPGNFDERNGCVVLVLRCPYNQVFEAHWGEIVSAFNSVSLPNKESIRDVLEKSEHTSLRAYFADISGHVLLSLKLLCEFILIAKDKADGAVAWEEKLTNQAFWKCGGDIPWLSDSEKSQCSNDVVKKFFDAVYNNTGDFFLTIDKIIAFIEAMTESSQSSTAC